MRGATSQEEQLPARTCSRLAGLLCREAACGEEEMSSDALLHPHPDHSRRRDNIYLGQEKEAVGGEVKQKRLRVP